MTVTSLLCAVPLDLPAVEPVVRLINRIYADRPETCTQYSCRNIPFRLSPP